MSSLNRPIEPSVINKSIAVPLLLVAGYLIWLSATSAVGLLIADPLYLLLPLAGVLTVIAFCILFAAQSFRNRHINGLAITVAILQLAGCVMVLGVASILGGVGGPAVLLGFLALYVVFSPVAIVAGVVAAVGITALFWPAKKPI